MHNKKSHKNERKKCQCKLKNKQNQITIGSIFILKSSIIYCLERIMNKLGESIFAKTNCHLELTSGLDMRDDTH